MARIGWITQDAKNRYLLLDLSGKARFFGKSGIERHVGLFEFLRIKRICEIERHTLVIGEAVAKFLKKKAHLEVARPRRGPSSTQERKVLEDMPTDEILFSSTAVFLLEFGDGLLGSASDKSHRARCRVEQCHPVRGQPIALVEFRL